jgi:HAD superfamily hydrolase (TIGR01509 family)
MSAHGRSLRAVIFDFDGLILDTETPEYLSWLKIYEEHTVSISIEEWAICIGTSNVLDPHAILEGRAGKGFDRVELSEQVRERRMDLLAREKLLPGVLDVLNEARALDLKVGLASSSSRSWVVGHLESLGIADRFHTIKTREDVDHVKPDPALYLRAVEALGVQPADAIALEDSYHGLCAARAAGLFCVAVPNPMTRHLPLHEADLLLRSLEELSLDSLVAGQ